MAQEQIITTIAAALKDKPTVRALFLSGSHATDWADAYSDIDFVLVADEGATDAIAQTWRDAISQTGEIVLWWDRTNVPVLINAITADWTRTDVVILKPEQIAQHAQSTLKPVFDPDNLYHTLPKRPAPRAQNPSRFKYQIEEFIRILGLLYLADGRQEYINGVLGVFHLRNLLVDLMIEDTNAPDRGGALHLNRLITEEQKAAITALPALHSNRTAMLDAHMAYAAEYLPRARKRAEVLGVDWPERFEAATWVKLEETLGLTKPY